MASRIIHLAIADCISKIYGYKDKNRLEFGSILPDAVTGGNSHLKNNISNGTKKHMIWQVFVPVFYLKYFRMIYILATIFIWCRICILEISCITVISGIHYHREMSRDCITTMRLSINMWYKNMRFQIPLRFLPPLMKSLYTNWDVFRPMNYWLI